MALKVDYVLRETATNLTRNVTLTLASIITIAVSLVAFGAALLLNQALENAEGKWRGGIEFIVYMQPRVEDAQLKSVESDLRDSPDVKEIEYVDLDETWEEFKRLYREQPNIVETIDRSALPTSFKVVPTNDDPRVVAALGDTFERKAGVREVIFAQETIEAMKRVFGKVGNAVIGAGLFLLGASILLILNTIRVAMFARRREIEVMKLVGATNWFIRVPFIVEGVVQALIGSALAVVGVFVARGLIEGLAEEKFPLFSEFVIFTDELWTTSLIVVLLGVIVGAVGSAFAASRFLDV
jgi:cell division transport system permease protein